MGLLSKLFKSSSTIQKSGEFVPISWNGKILDDNSQFNYTSYTDEELLEQGYAFNTDVYSIIKKLCDVSSDVPFIVEEKDGDEWVLNEGSALWNLINNPNEDKTGKEFRWESMLYLLNTGDIFWKSEKAAFDLINNLTLLPSNITELKFNSFNEVTGVEVDQFNKNVITYSWDDIIHTMYFNPTYCGLESKRGLSPLQAGYMSLKASNNRFTAQAALYENRGATNIISSGSDINLTPNEQKELQKNTDKILGGAKNFNKSIVTTKNINVNQLGMNATDLRLIEAFDLDIRAICNLFGVPSNMFNDTSASTESNVKTDNKKFYTDAIIPNNEKLISKYNKDIVPAYSSYEGKELRISQDLSNIDALQEDQLTKVQKQATEVNTILSITGDQTLTPEQKENLLNYLGYEL